MARHPLLEAYQASPDDPFDAVKAAHLCNRAGFGGTSEDIEEAVKAGPAGALGKLMSFPDKTAEQQGSDLPDFSLLAKYPKDPRMLRMTMEGKTDEERQRNFMQFQAAQRQTM